MSNAEQEICKSCGGHGDFIKAFILNKDFNIRKIREKCQACDDNGIPKMNYEKQLSNCCKAEIKVCSSKTTSYYQCAECFYACDLIYIQKPEK